MAKKTDKTDLKILIVSGSLNPASKSRALAKAAVEAVERLGAIPRLLDLRDHPLPLCDGEDSYDHEELPAVSAAISNAHAIILATPIYNFDASATVKNLIEMTGNAWKEKIVGFLCAAGGKASYMSVMGLANSLMLDFRCIVVPRFVYACREDFDGEAIKSEAIRERIDDIAQRTVTLVRGLYGG